MLEGKTVQLEWFQIIKLVYIVFLLTLLANWILKSYGFSFILLNVLDIIIYLSTAVWYSSSSCCPFFIKFSPESNFQLLSTARIWQIWSSFSTFYFISTGDLALNCLENIDLLHFMVSYFSENKQVIKWSQIEHSVCH